MKRKLAAGLIALASAAIVVPTPGPHASAEAACSIARTPFAYNQPTGTPYRFGGGTNYPDIVSSSGPCVTVVSTEAQLVSALSVATPGTAVFVAPSAQIDLSGDPTVLVPSGVTLASNRGSGGSLGALLYTNVASPGMIRLESDARLTGLRIRGHDSTNCATCVDSRGIVTFAPSIEVDNSEIYQWTFAGINLGASSTDAHVHHNFFRSNRKQERGYAIMLDSTPTDALIEWNRFNNNRHAVAGGGTSGQSYEARYNLVMFYSFGHVFDMHGNAAGGAGTTIKIHHNYIFHTDYTSVLIRGIPTDFSWTYANCIARAKSVSTAVFWKKHAIAQTLGDGEFSPTGYGHFSVGSTPTGGSAPNSYNQTAESCGVSADL